MTRLSMFPSLMREFLGVPCVERIPEPDLVMEGVDQVAAYVEAGRSDGGMAAVYAFHCARISSVIAACANVIDLGCGPGTLLAEIASLNPNIHFTGVDLSESMLEHARKYTEERQLTNVSFVREDITDLKSFQDKVADGIISTMALHHLPTLDHLNSCFAQIDRICKPKAAIYITDFTRLKYARSIKHISWMNKQYQSDFFSKDTERSLYASFSIDNFRELAKSISVDGVEIFKTAGAPLFMIIKTNDLPLRQDQIDMIQQKKERLSPRFQKDLNELRFFFKLGGLRNDPFGPKKNLKYL